ncbi:MAG: alpha/beta hydrolase [Pseudomonadales bacterium]
MSAKDLLPEGNYATLPNGQTIHYLDQGEGPVVVFLHGSGSGASGHSNFQGNYPAIAKQGYRVIVPDLVGYGFSDKPQDVDYHIDFFVECIKQTLDHAGVDKCTLIGNSLGGAIALKFALDYSSKTESLILMAPGGIEDQANYFTMPGMQLMREVFTSPEPVTPEKMKSFFLEAFVINPDCVDDELVAERHATMQLQNPHAMKTMVVPNMTERLSEITCPVLVFWGLDEKMMPPSGIMTLAHGLPNVRVELVSNCGHWVMLEHCDLFNRQCLGFLQYGE